MPVAPPIVHKKTCADWQNADETLTCAAHTHVFQPQDATAKLLKSKFAEKCCAEKPEEEGENTDSKQGCLQNKWVKRTGLAAVFAAVAYGGYKGYQNAAAVQAGLGQAWTWTSNSLGSAWTNVSGGVSDGASWLWTKLQALWCF